MEHIICDYCGKDSFTEIAQQTDLIHKTTNEEFIIVKCDNCGLNYTNPRPSQEEIKRYYASSYSFHKQKSKTHLWLTSIAKFLVKSPLSYLLDILGIGEKLIPYLTPNIQDPVMNFYRSGGTGKFLDIGCGSGISAHLWGPNGALFAYKKITNVAGIEIADNARKLLTAQGIQAWDSITAVPNEEKFTIIRMNWSLEHVHSPDKYFAFIASHLENKGRAIIAVPNYSGLIYKISPSCVELPIHLYHFTPNDMKNYGAKHGLKLFSIKTFSYPAMFNEATKLGLIPKSLSLASSLSEAKKLQKVLNKFDDAEMGNDMIAIFERK